MPSPSYLLFPFITIHGLGRVTTNSPSPKIPQTSPWYNPDSLLYLITDLHHSGFTEWDQQPTPLPITLAKHSSSSPSPNGISFPNSRINGRFSENTRFWEGEFWFNDLIDNHLNLFFISWKGYHLEKTASRTTFFNKNIKKHYHISSLWF